MPFNIDSIYDISINLNTDCSYQTGNYSKENSTRKIYNIIDTGYIYTLDPSDNLDYLGNPIRRYQSSRAEYLMKPFNKNQLRTSKFNNENKIYRIKNTLDTRGYVSDCSSSRSLINTMKTIQRQNRVDSSNYTTSLKSHVVAFDNRNNYNVLTNYNNGINNGLSDRIAPSITRINNVEYKGVDQKHGSYDRYLARIKSGNLKSKIPDNPESQTTKNFKLGIVNSCKC